MPGKLRPLILQVYQSDTKGWSYRLWRGKKLIMQGLESYRRQSSALQGARRLTKGVYLNGINVHQAKP